MVLATALTGNANYLVSEDKDLLVLNPYEGIQIIDAFVFLGILESIDAGEPEA
jgi:predicted nucleic acid-binding protein